MKMQKATMHTDECLKWYVTTMAQVCLNFFLTRRLGLHSSQQAKWMERGKRLYGKGFHFHLESHRIDSISRSPHLRK